ncbi:MAG TPA: hypothetical protein DCR44_05320 [Acholeplasmatales bacterium]|nr:hypothetical protein [Acholeplasmatales bacterium]
MKTFGLLGKHLSHSFSPIVHAAFGDPDYRTFETVDPIAFLEYEEFDGLNVTIPYKETVRAAMDVLDDVSARTGAINTIVRRNGKLYGYNTDYDGIAATFARYGGDPRGKTAAVIGNGGAAKTVIQYLKDGGAAQIDVFCRTPRAPGDLPLDEAGGSYAILVNATPIGMHPDDDGTPIDIARFPNLEFVFDFVYNPLRTNLVLAAIDRGIPAASGLYMLVMQARRARELFTDTLIPDTLAESVYRDLAVQQANVVLIGMPLSGKSMYATRLASGFEKTVFDTDAAIESCEGVAISDIFALRGEPAFRALEETIVEELAATRGIIVSTGGGMIKNPTAMQRLRHNGVVVFLDKDYRKIMAADIRNRPLIQSPADVERLALERRPIYERYADVKVEITGRQEETTKEIEAKIHAYFDRQRP